MTWWQQTQNNFDYMNQGMSYKKEQHSKIDPKRTPHIVGTPQQRQPSYQIDQANVVNKMGC